ALAFALVALPWYVWIGAETKTDFLRGFFLTHNLGRFLSPMENHRGPVFYYVLAFVVGFAPWSAFFGLACWYSAGEWKRAKAAEKRSSVLPDAGGFGSCAGVLPQAHAFLWCWIAVTFIFFSLAATKLPNYILPLYPPAALLTARFLDCWRRGVV